MKKNNPLFKNEINIEDIEEEINLEDFEDFEDADEEGSNGFNQDIEYKFYPMNKDYLTKLPDHFNPEKIRERREVVLFNPNRMSNPYTPTSGSKINLNNVCDELIILSKSEIKLIKTNKELSRKQSIIKKSHTEFLDKVKSRVTQKQKNGNAYKPKKNQNKSKYRKK